MYKTGLLRITTACVIGIMASSASAQTQWIQDTLSDQCSAASKEALAEDVRDSIEESVARAEASIQAPASVADLSCMNNLLNANLDIFSSQAGGFDSFNVDSMINDVVGGLKAGLSVQTLTGGVERAICDFAQEKFGDLTNGLTGSMDDIVSGTSDLPTFTDGFGLLNIGFNAGGSTVTGSTVNNEAFTNERSTGVSGRENATGAPAEGYSPTKTETEIQNIWNSISGGN